MNQVESIYHLGAKNFHGLQRTRAVIPHFAKYAAKLFFLRSKNCKCM